MTGTTHGPIFHGRKASVVQAAWRFPLQKCNKALCDGWVEGDTNKKASTGPCKPLPPASPMPNNVEDFWVERGWGEGEEGWMNEDSYRVDRLGLRSGRDGGKGSHQILSLLLTLLHWQEATQAPTSYFADPSNPIVAAEVFPWAMGWMPPWGDLLQSPDQNAASPAPAPLCHCAGLFCYDWAAHYVFSSKFKNIDFEAGTFQGWFWWTGPTPLQD